MKTNNNSSVAKDAMINCKRLFGLLVLFIIAFVYFTGFLPTKDSVKYIFDGNDKGLLLNTPGCQIPKLDPFDPSVKWLIKKIDPLVCRGKKVFLSAKENGTVYLNEKILKKFYNLSSNNVSCFYEPIFRQRMSEGKSENSFILGIRRRLRFGIPMAHEFLRIRCSVGKKSLTQFLPLVTLKSALKENNANESAKISVILLAIDSVSKLNFLRQFPMTQKILKKISPLELYGYTKVGDNTFPNIIPFLTGKSVNGDRKIRGLYFDSLDLIWKRFSNLNYTTYYAEDSPKSGTFNYLKKGFIFPPTDYYFRPMALAMESSQLRRNRFCFNSQLDIDIMYNYFANFVQTMNERPFFAFNFVSTMSHDELNTVGHADYPTYKLLNKLWKAGTFNKSILIFFSDHGIRFGKIRETYIGKFEERMPFIFLHFPQSFLSENPQVAHNLQVNQERLTTPFDIHATLLHLWTVLKSGSNIVGTDTFKTANGISLFNEIPDNRTCEDANILPHWCVCQTFHPISTTEEVSVKCALSVVEEINTKLEKHRDVCAELKLGNILSAILRLPNERVLRFLNDHYNKGKPYVEYGEKIDTVNDYIVTLSTQPSGGIFEGTVRNAEKGVFNVLGISRINAYGNQSSCINDQELQIFCYC